VRTEHIVGSGDARPQTAAPRALTVQANGATPTYSTTRIKHYVPPLAQQQLSPSTMSTATNANGGRRRASDLRGTYSAQCYRAGSSFTDASCGCLGKPKSSEFDLRPTIKIVAGSWYVPPDFLDWSCLSWICVVFVRCHAGVCQASWCDRRLHPEDLDRAGAGIPHRAGARRAVLRDPFESHGAIERVSSTRERRCSHVSRGNSSSLVRVPPPWLVFRVRLQVWHSEEAEWYDRYVRDAQSVLP
jgi:hypothetical protein